MRGSVKSKGCNEIIFISIVKRVFTVWRFLFTPAIHSISSYLVRGRNGLVCYNEVRCAAGFWHRFTSAKGDKNKMTAINIIPFRIKIFQTTFPLVRSEFSKCSIFDEKKGGGNDKIGTKINFGIDLNKKKIAHWRRRILKSREYPSVKFINIPLLMNFNFIPIY